MDCESATSIMEYGVFLQSIMAGTNRACRQSGFPTFIPCQRQDANVLPKRQQSHQGDKLCDVSTVPLVARWPVFLARGSDADGEPHCTEMEAMSTGVALEGIVPVNYKFQLYVLQQINLSNLDAVV